MTLLAMNEHFSSIAIRDAKANWHAPVGKRRDDLNNPYTRTVEDLQNYILGGASTFDGTYHVIELPDQDGNLLRPRK